MRTRALRSRVDHPNRTGGAPSGSKAVGAFQVIWGPGAHHSGPSPARWDTATTLTVLPGTAQDSLGRSSSVSGGLPDAAGTALVEAVNTLVDGLPRPTSAGLKTQVLACRIHTFGATPQGRPQPTRGSLARLSSSGCFAPRTTACDCARQSAREKGNLLIPCIFMPNISHQRTRATLDYSVKSNGSEARAAELRR